MDMKSVLTPTRLALCVALAVSPVFAEEDKDGLSLMEEGAMLFLKGLQWQVEPTLEDLGAMAEEFGPALKSFTEEMGPALGSLLGEVEDWSAYHPPEILDNGDIVIRRKAPEEMPKVEEEAEQTDL